MVQLILIGKNSLKVIFSVSGTHAMCLLDLSPTDHDRTYFPKVIY
jgi:hypothetical protein